MKELLSQYADGYVRLTEAVAGLTEEELRFKPAPDKWSVKEIIIHICDSEMAGIYRMKQIISEENPLLTAFDQDRWASRQQYNERDHKVYLELFGLLRESMLQVLGMLTVDDWQRTGVHTVVGKMSLYDVVGKFVDHLSGHLAQIERVRSAYKEQSSE